jgi:hypothetical protein
MNIDGEGWTSSGVRPVAQILVCVQKYSRLTAVINRSLELGEPNRSRS